MKAALLRLMNDENRNIIRELWANGEKDAALGILNRLIESDPDDFELYRFRGVTTAKKEDYAESLEDFDRYLEHAPNDCVALIPRGTCRLMVGDC